MNMKGLALKCCADYQTTTCDVAG